MENSEKKKYFPYPSDRPAKKFYIITNDNKKVYFGDSNFQHFTEGHLDERRKWAYISRHRRNENWSNPDTAGFWAFHYLWLYPTYEQAMKRINKIIKKKYYKKSYLT
jgi:hypothetical protein